MKEILTIALLAVSCILSAQDFESVLIKANSKFFDENYQEALSDYKSLIKSEVGDSIQRSWAFGYIGVCLQELGETKEAVVNYRKALDMGTPGASFYSKLLAIYKSKKNVEGQEFVLLSKKKNMPIKAQSALKSLAYLYVNSKQFNKLLSVCDELIEYYPNNYKYRYFRAISYQKLKDIEKAKEEYRAAIQLKPNDINSNMNLGMILFLKANKAYDKSVRKYEALAKPTDADYQKCKRNLASHIKLMLKAEPFLLNAYKGKPSANLKNALYNLYRKCNEHAKAKNYHE